MTKAIEARKQDHLKLAQDPSLGFERSAGFQRWRFLHNALPELDLAQVDTGVKFLGKDLALPLLISSMSGGADAALRLNHNLALAAQTTGCALGLGSIRAALEHPQLADSFLIARETAPEAVILANLGLGQAKEPAMLDRTAGFCERLQANGLFLHLNSLQEAFQLGGDVDFRHGLATIERWVDEFPLPIIVKEVGQGLAPDLVKRLEDVGVTHVDIAGAGGSNWINIEAQRLPAEAAVLKDAAPYFANWGNPTAQVLEQLDTTCFVIASGGVQNPMDMSLALALGARLVGVAGPFLTAAMADHQVIIHQIQVWQETLRRVLYGTGTPDIATLVGNWALLVPNHD